MTRHHCCYRVMAAQNWKYRNGLNACVNMVPEADEQQRRERQRPPPGESRHPVAYLHALKRDDDAHAQNCERESRVDLSRQQGRHAERTHSQPSIAPI